VSQYFGRGVSAPMVAKRLASQGCVYINPKGWIQLKKPDWVWIEEDESLFLQEACHALSSHTEALLHNMEALKSKREKWVERRVFTMHIPENQYERARQIFNDCLKKQEDEIAEKMQALEDAGDTHCKTIGVGYYYWESKN
jgi:hypothetical protein